MTVVLPQKGIKCHRTFGRAKPVDCHTMVCEHGCQLWRRVTLTDRDPETGAEIGKDVYACMDVQEDIFRKDFLRRQLQTTATVDKLARVVTETNAGAMGAILGSVNQQLVQIANQGANGLLPAPPDAAQKMIEN